MNLRALKKGMERVGTSMTQRKQNLHDPIANPVYFHKPNQRVKRNTEGLKEVHEIRDANIKLDTYKKRIK